MTEIVNDAVRRFLSDFFGVENKIKLGSILNGEFGCGVLVPWLLRLDREEPLPTILPRKIESTLGGDKYVWYGVAKSERELRDLAETVYAFLGPSYSSFNRVLSSPDPDNLTDQVVFAFAGNRFLKFEAPIKQAWVKLEELRKVCWETERPIASVSVRTPGRVLRDFSIALQVGNRLKAEESLNELQQHHGFDALNLAFLRVQLHAEFGEWSKLLDLPILGDILRVRRPVAVTHALVKAVYLEKLRQFENVNDAEGALRHFSEDVYPRFGALFTSKTSIQGPEEAKALMLLAVHSRPSDYSLKDKILLRTDFSNQDLAYLNAIAALGVPAVDIATPIDENITAISKAFELNAQGNYDQALELVSKLTPSLERTKVLLLCAYEIQSLEVESLAARALEDLDEEDQGKLLSSRSTKKIIQELFGSSTVVRTQPATWDEWLDRIYAEPSWNRALEVAKRGAQEWRFDNNFPTALQSSQLAEKLLNYPSAAETTLYNALPHFIEHIIHNDGSFPRPEFSNLYIVLLELLILSSQGGDDDLSLFNDITVALFSIGISNKEYLEILNSAEDFWDRVSSPAKLDWILDFLDSNLYFACPDKVELVNLFTKVVNSITVFQRRISEVQWSFLSLLATDFDEASCIELVSKIRPQQVSADQLPQDPLIGLAGKVMTIYTLTERVGRRVRENLEAKYANLTVNVSSDHVGSEQLRHWARNSDIFVIVTASAKHAATEFIEANRQSRPIIRPTGKGSASVFTALAKFLSGGST